MIRRAITNFPKVTGNPPVQEEENTTQPSPTEDNDEEDTQPTPTPANPDDNQLQSLLEQAQQTFDNANKALEDGDLGRYQDLIDQGQTLVQQATELLEGN